MKGKTQGVTLGCNRFHYLQSQIALLHLDEDNFLTSAIEFTFDLLVICVSKS